MRTLFVLSIVLLFNQITSAEDKIKVADLPAISVQPCLDGRGEIAEIGEKWNHSHRAGSKLSSTRLVQVCETNGKLEVLCEKRGFVGTSIKVTVRKGVNEETWGNRTVENVSRDFRLGCESKSLRAKNDVQLLDSDKVSNCYAFGTARTNTRRTSDRCDYENHGR